MSAVTNERVFKWWDYPLFCVLSIASYVAIYLVLSHWVSVADWQGSPFACSIWTGIVLVVLINNQGRWHLLPLMRKPRPMVPRDGWRVAVATTIVPTAEPIEMLRETVKAMVALDYPHDTWVLDEGNHDEVKALCESLGAKHFSRKNMPQYQTASGIFRSASKHGNYNAWLHEIGFEQYDFLTTFDPDHVPHPSFLVAVLGYFEDPGVGYVQAAQAYYNQSASFIAAGAAEETYDYFSTVQMASHGMGYPIVVGSHNSHRLAALKQVGGFPAHDAEDLLLTLFYRAQHWRGVYVPAVLARGLAPVDWRGYLGQQRRWARSVLDIKWRRSGSSVQSLGLKSRIMNFLHGINYLHRALLIILVLLLVSYMFVTRTAPLRVTYQAVQLFGLLFAVLQLCEFYRQRFYLTRRQERGWHWRAALLRYAKWPWFLAAVVDVISNTDKPYELTSKVPSGPGQHMLLWPNLFLFLAMLAVVLFDWLLEIPEPALLRIWAFALMVLSGVLIWTDFWRFPKPFDRTLLDRSLANRNR